MSRLEALTQALASEAATIEEQWGGPPNRQSDDRLEEVAAAEYWTLVDVIRRLQGELTWRAQNCPS